MAQDTTGARSDSEAEQADSQSAVRCDECTTYARARRDWRKKNGIDVTQTRQESEHMSSLNGWSPQEIERARGTRAEDETVADRVVALRTLGKMPGQKEIYEKRVDALLKDRGLN